MGVSAKGGQLTSPTSTGNQSTTGIGFQPKVVIFYSTLQTDAAACSPCLGAGVSSSARWCMSEYADVPPGTGTARLFDSSKVFRCVTNVAGGGLSNFLTCDLVSLDSDGFTVNWSVVQGSGYPINYVCFAGSDLSVHLGTFDTNSSTGNQSITGVGFQPKAIFFGAGDLASFDGTALSGSAHIGIGAAISSSARSALSSAAVPVSPTQTGGVLRTDKCWQWTFPETTTYGDADFVSLDSDGFTVNITTVTSASVFRVGYVALGGNAQFKTSTFAQPASTGNQSVTGIGFTPTCELFWTGGKVSNNSLTVNARFGFSHAVSSSDRGTIYAAIRNGDTNAAMTRATLTNKSITIRDDASTTVLADADLVSQDNDGFTNNWTTVDATARIMAYLAIGAPAGYRVLLLRS